MGAPMWPPNPQRSGRPGKAVAPLDNALGALLSISQAHHKTAAPATMR